MADTPEPEREGYVFVGNVSVDSGMMVIGDPSLILPARTEEYAGGGYDPTIEDAMAALKDTRATGFVDFTERRETRTLAVAVRPGYGDGEYSVFAKIDEHRHVVEIVIDMQMDKFQKALFRTKKD